MADNWEDRLAGQIPASKAKANWEDRLRAAPMQDAPDITSQGSSLKILNPFGTDINTGIPMNSTATNLLAGVGKGMNDIVQGVKQRAGLVTNADVANDRRLDAPLMNTTAGKVGNFIGQTAPYSLAAFIPGANTIVGSTLTGGGVGLLQPSESTNELLQNAAMGSGAGLLGNLAGRGIGAAANVVRTVAQPFFKGGQQQIANDTLKRFAVDPKTTAVNLFNTKQLIPGSFPTAAEGANDAGIAQLQQQLGQIDPQVGSLFKNRQIQNNDARVAAVRSIAGDDVTRNSAIDARNKAIEDLYSQAKAQTVPVDDELTSILNTPAGKNAVAAANNKFSNIRESGITSGDSAKPSVVLDSSGNPAFTTDATSPTIDGKYLHEIKLALDKFSNLNPQNSADVSALNGVSDVRNSFNSWLDKNLPIYGQARDAYATLSHPINQMDLGTALVNKLVPAIQDFGATGGLNTNSFANAMRNGDALAQNVTGFKGATLDNTLTSQNMGLLNNVGQDLGRVSTANYLASTPGSPTARNLVSQNIISGIAGPLGIPQHALANNTLMQSLLAPAQWAANLAEPRVLQTLGETMLDPKATALALTRANGTNFPMMLSNGLRRYMPPMLAAPTAGLLQPSVDISQ